MLFIKKINYFTIIMGFFFFLQFGSAAERTPNSWITSRGLRLHIQKMGVMVVTTLPTVHDAPGTVPGAERVSRSDHADYFMASM